MADIVIRTPFLSIGDAFATLSADIVFAEGEKRLWFECDAAHAHMLSPETCDGFVVALLALAMLRGDDLVVEGQLSSRLFYNLASYYIPLLQHLIEGTKKIEVKAERLTRRNWGGKGVFTGFSGGVDSFCAIIDHAPGRVPPEFVVTNLVFCNVGSHGRGEGGLAWYERRLARLQRDSRALDLPLIGVNSNLDAVIGLDFQQTHTLRNLAVALLFQKACGKYLYASTYHYREERVRETHDIAYADSIGVPLLSTETTECISSGGQYNKFEKTRIVSSFPPTYGALDVCVEPERAGDKINCSKCWKCLRTQLRLEVMGELDRYEEVFSLPTYRKFRWLLLCDVMSSRDAMVVDIKKEIEKGNFQTPLSARLFAKLVPNAAICILLSEWTWSDKDKLSVVVTRILRRGLSRWARTDT